jgi:2'-5' RNA ligase
MAFAVVLFFDAATEATIRNVAGGLAQDGIPADLFVGDLRPHISLGVCDTLDPDGFRAVFMAFAALTPAGDFTLASVGIFPTSAVGVLFLAPIVTSTLLSLHAHFHTLFARYAVSQQDYYLPGNWVPHCTLALNVPLERLAAVVEAASRTAGLPLRGRYESIGLIQFLPARDVYTAPLVQTGYRPV